MRVGIDLVCIEEVSTSLARFRSRYLDRIFTQDECADCLRETAKVAPGKPRGTFRGWCELRLSGAAAALADARGLGELEVSLSHDGTYATAVVVAEERGKGRRVE
jgi:phosphopantetheinyl transferase (holo-ACP synthase)